MSEPSSEARWQRYVRHAADALFLLDRRRRLVFANGAWEACTGMTLADVRGRPCRAVRASDAERGIAAISVLAPPPEALAGQSCRARRRAAPAGAWWQLDFFPIQGEDGLLGILGKITVLPAPAASAAPLPDRVLALRDRVAQTYRLDALPSEPPAMSRVVEQARLAAQSRLPVTLLGASGTGKHWLARAIHQASAERERAFARIDAGGLPAPLLAEWLLTTRVPLGTIYLREPAELPRELQERLVQRLRGGDGPRLILGQRGDPQEAIRGGRLLDELHYAASTLTIALPPLRERLAELDAFIRVFLSRAQRIAETAARDVSPEALAALRGHAWPGNLRELYDVLLSAARHARGERIELADLPYFLRSGPAPVERKLPLDQLLEEAERRIIQLALRRARGNRSRAAGILGIWRPRLLRRLEHFGIEGEDNENGHS